MRTFECTQQTVVKCMQIVFMHGLTNVSCMVLLQKTTFMINTINRLKCVVENNNKKLNNLFETTSELPNQANDK